MIGFSLRPTVFVMAAMVAVMFASAAHASEAAWAALREGGAAAIMRHALAPGTGDPPNFKLGECATQRNLDERGRTQARAIGQAFRENGVVVDRVLSSAWCRSTETAQLLGLGEVETFAPLNSFFADRTTRQQQTDATAAFLAQLPEGVTPVLVTHQVNITALTGRFASSGEIVVITVADDGAVDVVGDINIRW
ncbi:MAG: histidine phosphatase family protein [Devosia sp.]